MSLRLLHVPRLQPRISTGSLYTQSADRSYHTTGRVFAVRNVLASSLQLRVIPRPSACRNFAQGPSRPGHAKAAHFSHFSGLSSRLTSRSVATSARVEPDYHYVQWSAELNLGYYKSIPFEAEPIKHLLIPFENSRLRREISRDASQSFTHDEVKAYNSRVLYGVNKADTLNAIEYYDLLRSSPHILCIYTDASRFLNYLGAAAVFPSLNYHTASCNLGWSTQGHCTLARIMQSTFADVTTTGHDIWSAELVGILLGLEAACQLASSGQKIAMFTDQTRLYRKPTGLPWGELYGKVASALSKLHAKDVVVMTYYLPGRSDVEGVRRAHKAAMEAAFPKSMSILPELRSKFFACMELRSPITILCQKTKRRLRSLVVANSVSNTKAQPESLTAIGNAPDMDPINVVRRVPESTAKTRLNFYLPPSRGQANSVPREELGTERNAYEANLATNLDQCLPEMSSRTQKSSSAEQGIQSPRLRRTREPLNIKTVALPPRRSDPARRVGSKKQRKNQLGHQRRSAVAPSGISQEGHSIAP